MKKILLIIICIVAGGVYTFARFTFEFAPAEVVESDTSSTAPVSSPEEIETLGYTGSEGRGNFSEPLQKAAERVTKKPFGVYIDPATSPVRPERFSGYHTGTDFEIFPGEEDEDVAVSAICTGELLAKRTASGYGGVVVQSCEYEDKPVTVVYGHVQLSSVASKIGDEILAGELLGHLGTGFSTETDGERKHLHLSIHRGTEGDIRGYVASAAELSDWIDPCLLFCE